jgi:uncharacterized protein with FMN-binding domain
MIPLLGAQNINIDIATESFLSSRNASSRITADGSPYIDDNFSGVRISKYKNKVYNARYNAFNGELEVKIENDRIIALDFNDNVEVTFTLTDKKYRAVDYVKENSTSKKGFLVVLSESQNLTLFKEERIKFFEKVEAASSYQQDKAAKFQREDDLYYIKASDNMIKFLPKRKKDFLRVFPKQSKKLKSYLKENKLNPKNEDELITIIKYLSTIVE